MTNLTEQWKKGDLPKGLYYVKAMDYYTGEQYQDIDVFDGNCWKRFAGVTEVLAEVPSYEKYQNLLSDQLAKEEGEEINAELEERLKKTQALELEARRENTKLKELLKRAKDILEDEGDYMIVQEINQVLQEK